MYHLRLSGVPVMTGLFLTVVVVLPAFGGSVLFVDDDAPGGGDGLGWDTAYRFVQDALSDAAGGGVDEIYVAQGVYNPDEDEANPDGTGDRSASFNLLSNLALIGGYAGFDAPDPDARDVDMYETFLSGDLLDNDRPDFVNYEENSYHVVRTNVVTGATLDGFTVTAGRAEEPDVYGGGMHNTDSSFSVIGCRFLANLCDDDGGGMFNFNSDVLMSDCTFSWNVSLGVSGTGGGAVASFSSQVVMLNCDLHDNEGFLGGALADAHQGTTSLLINCSLTNNRATGLGGAIFNQNIVRVLINCIIEGNLFQGVRNGFPNFESGGGMFNQLTSTSIWVNVRATGNTAGGDGGAVYNNFRSTASFVNCTFADNSAFLEGGGIYNSDVDGTIHVDNSILWGNSDAGGIDESAQVQLNGGAGSLNFSCLQGLTGDLGGVGNIDEDPMFVDPEISDYRLMSGSPSIDAGNNWGVPIDENDYDEDGVWCELFPVDLDGNPRFNADESDFDPGCGAPVVVDMGAYEYQFDPADQVAFADLNGDNAVSAADLLGLLASWGPCAKRCCLADLDTDGNVGASDLLVLLENWGPCS